MTMELDDLKVAWRELDRRLDASLALNRRTLTELRLDKARSALRPLTGVLVYELLSGIVAALLCGSFLADHIDDAKFAVPAAALLVVAAFTIAAAVRQLALIGRIDYAAPVVAIQRELAALRATRVRTTRWLLLLSPLLWTPLAVVAAKGLWGFDSYRGFGVAWVAWNLAFGVAAIPLLVWLARRFGDSRVGDALAGRSLAKATGWLDDVTRFAGEG